MTTTAASTSYLYQGAVVLGNGDKYVGAMVSNKSVLEPPARVLRRHRRHGCRPRGRRALRAGHARSEPAADGKIVVCDRGVFDRVAKSAEVARVGGVGMVLANVTTTAPTRTSTPCRPCTSTCPTPTRCATTRQEAGATARLDAAGKDATAIPQIAGFSSRGPAVPGGGDILKPDISAPGVSIVAAVAPPSNFGRKWDLYSGTSMASPHIAGLAAFIHRLGRPGRR